MGIDMLSSQGKMPNRGVKKLSFRSVIFLLGHFSDTVSQMVVLAQLKEQQALVEGYKKTRIAGQKDKARGNGIKLKEGRF